MKEKNKVFVRVFEWLYMHGKAIDQADIAAKTGISATTISRIINHGVGRPDEKTIRKINAAFGNIFNPDFLRGQSDIMLIEELSRDKATINSNQQQLTSTLPDYGSMTNAIIAAKDDAIMSLKRELAKTEDSAKRELAAKEETISALRGQINSKDAHIETLNRQIEDLRAQLALQQMKDAVGNFPFTIGAAEDSNRQSAEK